MILFLFIPSVQCQRDEDCPFDKTCKSNECVDPCPLTICGSRAQCKPERHKGICVCPAGLQGNPYVSCTEVGCQSHEDCSYDEKCDFPSPSSGRRECVRLCITPSCAQGARCEAKNHKEICTCNYPLQGDGYISCLERKSPMGGRGVFRSRFLKTTFLSLVCTAYEPDVPECRVDADCPSKLACIRQKCQNPCVIGNPCSSSQTCVVTDSLPSRSVACQCPDRQVAGPNGECRAGIPLRLTLV